MHRKVMMVHMEANTVALLGKAWVLLVLRRTTLLKTEAGKKGAMNKKQQFQPCQFLFQLPVPASGFRGGVSSPLQAVFRLPLPAYSSAPHPPAPD